MSPEECAAAVAVLAGGEGGPADEEKVVAAELATVGLEEPVDGAFNRVADADAAEFDALAMGTGTGESHLYLPAAPGETGLR